MAETETLDEDALRREFDATLLKTFRRNRDEGTMESVEQDGFERRRSKFKKILESDSDFYILFHSANFSAAHGR